ncbi:MAG: GIY-YIG nuclease family protein [Patescibacteria group bacterium]|jgi:putative endonuclease
MKLIAIPYFVYVLLSLKDRRLYTGFTTDLDRRMKEHNEGTTKSTKNRRPFVLLYYEVYRTEQEAKKREKFLKGGNGRAALKQQLNLTLKNFAYKNL